MSGFEDVPMFDPAGNPVDAPESPPEPVTGHLAEGRRRKESGQAQAATAAAWWTDAAMRWFTRLEAGAWVTADDLIEAIGPVQYLTLDKAHEGLTYQAVTPDFYERYSASRATRSTSSS